MDFSKLRGLLCCRHHADRVAERLQERGIRSIVIPGSGPLQPWRVIKTDQHTPRTVSRKDRVCLG